jgi:hypothetical protein
MKLIEFFNEDGKGDLARGIAQGGLNFVNGIRSSSGKSAMKNPITGKDIKFDSKSKTSSHGYERRDIRPDERLKGLLDDVFDYEKGDKDKIEMNVKHAIKVAQKLKKNPDEAKKALLDTLTKYKRYMKNPTLNPIQQRVFNELIGVK